MDSVNSYYSNHENYEDNFEEKKLLDININDSLSYQKKIIKKVKILLTVTLIFSLFAFIIGAINLIE